MFENNLKCRILDFVSFEIDLSGNTVWPHI